MDDGCWTRMISGEEVKSDWIFGYILKTELSECAYWIRHWMCRHWTDQGGLQSLSWAAARIKFAIYSYGKRVRGVGLVRWWGSGLSLRLIFTTILFIPLLHSTNINWVPTLCQARHCARCWRYNRVRTDTVSLIIMISFIPLLNNICWLPSMWGVLI